MTRAEALDIATTALTTAAEGGPPAVVEASASVVRAAMLVYDRLPVEPEPAPPSTYLHPVPSP